MNNNNTSAPLALRPDAPAVFGTRDEITAIAERIKVMLPSAQLSDWQMKRDDRAVIEKRLSNSVYRAAQLSVFYRLVPGTDVHVIPFGDDWAVDMGIETWRKAADRYCSLHGITYHIHTEEMPLAELKERRGDLYDADDCGVVAYLWRSDKKDVYEIFGAKQSMSRAAGVWAKKAKQVKGEWKPDQIPTQRSKQDVAKRRAMKAVLKLEFSLDSLLAATPAEMRSNYDALDMTLRAEQRRTALTASRRVEVDEDGCVVVQAQATRQTIQDVEFVVAEEPQPTEEPDVDELIESADNDSNETHYRALAGKLSGREASFVTWAKNAHLNSSGPCTVEQYRYLVGILNSIAATKDAHRLILGVMLGRAVSSDNRPGIGMVSKLIDWLVAESKDEVTGEKIPNRAYRQDYADSIKAMYALVKDGAA